MKCQCGTEMDRMRHRIYGEAKYKCSSCGKTVTNKTQFIKERVEQEQIYPFYWNNREWSEEDCDEVFVSFYTAKIARRDDGSVYIGDGVSIFPDGTMHNE